MLSADGSFSATEDAALQAEGKTKTMAYQVLKSHNHSDNMDQLQLKFDALVSPDNNYVNILQTARASGIKKFPVPYVLSNCHHTLCAVGGTINEDDHVFGLGNAKKYGGIFVPPYRAVLHQYMREMMAGGGRMILGSDSHSRYGALGTMGIGEGGGEVAKQLLGRTYDIAYPPVLAVKLTGTPRPGVGPQDVALALIAATFQNNFNKNKVLELAENQTSLLTSAYFDQTYNSQPTYIAKKGYSMGMMYGYMYEGTYKYEDFYKSGDTYVLRPGVPYFSSENNTQPGMPKYKDLNGDGIIDTNDRTMIGRGLPIHTGGFTNDFEYKGFDLSIFFQWSYGNDVLNANRLFFENVNNSRNLNQYATYADRWTPENPTSNIPVAKNSSSNKVVSSRVIEDGSFLRLKTLTLGYTLPKKALRKWGISTARVYVAGQNLWTISGYSGYDPEVSIRNSALTPGLDYSAYPRAYAVNFGINLGF